MGNLANKCIEAYDKMRIFDINKDEQNTENTINKEITSNSSRRNSRFKNSYNINDIVIPSKQIQNNNKNININENNIDISKIEKIQNSYHKYYLKKKFETEIKPSLTKKTSDHINKYYTFFSSQGDVSKNLEDFSSDKWKTFYPSNDKFFIFDKGEVYPNQIRIKNEKDLNNIEIYEGEINNKNMKHGNGTLSNPHYVLKGTWRDDQFTGWGIKCMRNGEYFEGKFINGQLNGKGIYKYKNNIYKGDFVNNQRCGIGDLTTDKFHYKGEFKNNKLEGQGQIDFFEEGQRYEGTFSDNKINGKGTYKWKNGDVYVGEIKNGKMNGFGKYSYSDGKIYEGEFVNDIKHGKGKMTFPDGTIHEGNFVNGELNEEKNNKNN